MRREEHKWLNAGETFESADLRDVLADIRSASMRHRRVVATC